MVKQISGIPFFLFVLLVTKLSKSIISPSYKVVVKRKPAAQTALPSSTIIYQQVIFFLYLLHCFNKAFKTMVYLRSFITSKHSATFFLIMPVLLSCYHYFATNLFSPNIKSPSGQLCRYFSFSDSLQTPG